MKNKDFVYEALEVIEDNLKSDINVYSVSQQYGFSLYYFSRIFKGVTGNNLKDYILSRKISEAYLEIMKTDKKIIDIAFDYGFSTHESFSRAFNKIIGENPSDVRKNINPKNINLTAPLTQEKIESIEKYSRQTPEEIILDEILLVGVPFYFDLTLQNDLSKPWANLISNVKQIKNRIAPEKYYQMQYWFADQEPDFFYFFIAAQVKEIKDIPIQFVAKTIPKQKYLKFLHKGKSNTVGTTYQYIYDSFLPETEYRLPHFYNFEHCGKDFKGPYDDDSITEIYIPVE